MPRRSMKGVGVATVGGLGDRGGEVGNERAAVQSAHAFEPDQTIAHEECRSWEVCRVQRAGGNEIGEGEVSRLDARRPCRAR